jgi:NADH-quinone oxidoreductase subunit M
MTRVAALGIFLALPVVPGAAARAAPILAAIGVAGILVGALRLGRRRSPRELAADLAPFHGGLALLAVSVVAAAGGEGPATGLLLLLAGQGLASALIVLVADAVEARGVAPRGLLRSAPVLGALTVLASLAALGIPGTPGYSGGLLVLAGAAGMSTTLLVLAAGGLLLGATGLLRSVWRLVQGDPEPAGPDLAGDEALPLFLLAAATVLIGLVPKIVLLRAADPLARLVANLAGGG